MKLLASNGEGRQKENEMFSVPLSDIIERNQVHSRKRRPSASDNEISTEKKTRKRKISAGENCNEANKEKKDSKKSKKNEDSKSMKVLDRIFRSDSAEETEKAPKKEPVEDCQLFCLEAEGERACLTASNKKPISLDNIRHLLLKSVAGKASPTNAEEWCKLRNTEQATQTVFLVLNGLSAFHFLCHEDLFTETNEIFKTKLEVKVPETGINNFFKKYVLAEVPVSRKEALMMEYGDLGTLVEQGEGNYLLGSNIADTENDSPDGPLPEGDKFSRTKLLLSVLQMIEEDYPWPYKDKFKGVHESYVKTKDKYEPVTSRSPLYAVDCEMCKTSASTQELTRISIVNENMECVYESLVRPYNKIIDYLTQYSGITPEMMLTATKMLPQVQSEIREILPADAILVGQSLNFDLHAMKMMHPYVIDTSVIYNASGTRYIKPKLKSLARYYLNEDIQMNKDGHDSLEDSLASLKLTKLKLSKSVEFGDKVSMQNNALYHNVLAYAKKLGRRTAVVSTKDISADFDMFECNTFKSGNSANPINEEKSEAIDYFEISSNKLATKKVKEITSDFSFIVINLNMEPEKLQVSSIEKTITNVDKWISRVWKSVQPNGLFVALLAGAKGISDGVALIKAKENYN